MSRTNRYFGLLNGLSKELIKLPLPLLLSFLFALQITKQKSFA